MLSLTPTRLITKIRQPVVNSMKSSCLVLLMCFLSSSCLSQALEVYVYQSSELKGEFTSSYFESNQSFRALAFSESQAEEAYVRLVSHLIQVVRNSSKNNFSDNTSRILFSLDDYFIQIFKFSKEGEEFLSFWAVHEDLIGGSESIPESLVVIDGGGLGYWSVTYNISKSKFNQITVNSDW